jgi:hypothetical protein
MKLQRVLNERSFVEFTQYSLEEEEEVNENGPSFVVTTKELDIVTPWPKYLINVHNYDLHGAIPYRVTKPVRDCLTDTRVLWILKGLILLNPDIWSSTVNMATNNMHWSGWLMMTLNEVLPTNSQLSRIKQLFGCYKTGKSDLELYAMRYLGMKATDKFEKIYEITGIHYEIEYSNGEFNPQLLRNLFSKNNDIEVFTNLNEDIQAVRNNVKSIIVVRDDMQSDIELEPFIIDQNLNKYELRNVYCSRIITEATKSWQGSLYFRHGGEGFSNWWKQTASGIPTKVIIDVLSLDDYSNWNVAVYSLVKNADFEEVKAFLIEHVGGQHKVSCNEHKIPLIVAPRKSHKQCLANFHFRRKVYFQCPVVNFRSSYCSNHYQELILNTNNQEQLEQNNELNDDNNESVDDSIDSSTNLSDTENVDEHNHFHWTTEMEDEFITYANMDDVVPSFSDDDTNSYYSDSSGNDDNEWFKNVPTTINQGKPVFFGARK